MRTTLTAEELRDCGPSLRAQLSQKRGPWGLLGWSFRGPPGAIEVEVKIGGGRGRKLPRVPALRLPRDLGGLLRLRVAVAAGRPLKTSQKEEVPVGALSFAPETYAPVVHPLAPGAPILVGTGSDQKTGGIAAVVVLDGKLHLLTCGHLFDGPADVFTRETGAQIATLTRSYLSTSEPIDAAVCELVGDGPALLQRSSGADTWLAGWRRPTLSDNGATVVFWPTYRERTAPFEEPVSAVDAATSVLFFRGPQEGFIELHRSVIPGDSGSLLALDGRYYYGLCSGQVQGSWSYFTPIAAALDRLCGDYQEVDLWQPSTDRSV